jgi:hypothetical protein
MFELAALYLSQSSHSKACAKTIFDHVVSIKPVTTKISFAAYNKICQVHNIIQRIVIYSDKEQRLC